MDETINDTPFPLCYIPTRYSTNGFGKIISCQTLCVCENESDANMFVKRLKTNAEAAATNYSSPQPISVQKTKTAYFIVDDDQLPNEPCLVYCVVTYLTNDDDPTAKIISMFPDVVCSNETNAIEYKRMLVSRGSVNGQRVKNVLIHKLPYYPDMMEWYRY